ncbi:jg15537 [Pararge aegeria aegeria]|uniref:Jg15537 protein n=1 Tax=Pararge aegeria aegeria TaxID=348720 RepID=A0A8S4RV69_9NEOP|nr:jg15537 [Pararge aegeria aegeria]
MAGTLFRSFINTTLSFQKQNFTIIRSINTGSVFYAARKGTRAKARAKKVKVEITKVGFIPHNQRGKDKVAKVNINKHQDMSYKLISNDDVFPMRYYQWVVYTAEDAVKAHQETHHPTMYNDTNAYVYAQVSINMEAAKKLNMEAKQVAENIDSLLKDIQSVRPKRDGLFITRCLIVSPPSSEKLKIDPFVHVDRTLSNEVQEDSDDEDEAAAAKA